MANINIHAVLGSLVVTVGFWLIFTDLGTGATVFVAVSVASLLIYLGRSIGMVWALATFLLGAECLAWPFVTMIGTRMTTPEPSDQQMGQILTSVIWGLPTGIFWLTFSWGVFKRWGQPAPGG